MSDSDRNKWNRKYREKPTLLGPRPPSPMVEAFAFRTEGRNAVDLACGNGRNTLFLATNGFHVDAVDISSVALKDLQNRVKELDVTLYENDLDTFVPKTNRYDLAVMTNYLDRALIMRMAEALKQGSVFIIETYMVHPENEKKDSNPNFLLAKEELLTFFDDRFDILEYREFWNESHELYRMRKQGIAALKKRS